MYTIDVASESSDSFASSSSSGYSHPASEIASFSTSSPPTSPAASSFTSKIASSLRRTFKKRISTPRLTVYGSDLSSTTSICPTLPSIIFNVNGNPLKSLSLTCKSASQLENFLASLSSASYPNVTSLEIRFVPLREKDMQYAHLHLPRAGSDLPPITKVSLSGWNLHLVDWLTTHFRLTEFYLKGQSPCASVSMQKLIDANTETLTDLGLVLGSKGTLTIRFHTTRLLLTHARFLQPVVHG
ncbi:hypothetical protein CPB85DRAFT_1307878 [Mucidula mucida]|nr:hypothetical protein CPB85DRAFT_1307878 [Mucidula mucida]